MTVPIREPTEQEIKNFYAYRQVQRSGAYNMWSRQAREEAGLDRDEHLFIIQNYEWLNSYANPDL